MRFLFTANPLTGHLLPMLPLAGAARTAGHDVVIASGPDLAAEVNRRGFTAWSIGQSLAEIQDAMRSRPHPAVESDLERAIDNGLALFAVPAVARARDLIRLAACWQPDVVVQEIYELGGAYVGPADGLRVLHGLGADYPDFRRLAMICGAEVARRIGGPDPFDGFLDQPYVDPFPAVLHPPDDRPFPDVWPIRPEAGEIHPGDALPPDFDRLPYERSVYLTLGTVFNAAEAFRAPIDALGQLPVNVFVTCGRSADLSALGPLPDNVAVAGYVSQALLLPRCAAVVSHAGAGTLIGGLSVGLPQVCLPKGADQFVNAAQVTRTGAGITLMPDQADPQAIRRAVETVLSDERYRQAAAHVGAEIAALPSPADVLGRITARAESLSQPTKVRA